MIPRLPDLTRLLTVAAALAVTIPASRVVAERDTRPVKKVEVSPKVAERLELARRALRFANVAIPFEGNQIVANQKTQGNAWNRMLATRNGRLIDRLTGDDARLARLDPLAAEAAVIACTRGGNCGENAQMAFHYMATHEDAGHPFHMISVDGMDHAYVLIGDLDKDPDHEIVVIDSWVLTSEPTLWSDFDFHEADRSKINVWWSSSALPAQGGQHSRNRARLARVLRASLKQKPEPRITRTVDDLSKLDHQWNQPYPTAAFNPEYVTVGEPQDAARRRLAERLVRQRAAARAQRLGGRAGR